MWPRPRPEIIGTTRRTRRPPARAAARSCRRRRRSSACRPGPGQVGELDHRARAHHRVGQGERLLVVEAAEEHRHEPRRRPGSRDRAGGDGADERAQVIARVALAVALGADERAGRTRWSSRSSVPARDRLAAHDLDRGAGRRGGWRRPRSSSSRPPACGCRPAALMPMSAPTTARMSLTSSSVAPPPAKPVEVLTKSAPATLASEQPTIFSSVVSSVVSRMTLGRRAARRPRPRRRCRARPVSWSCDLSAPMLITMSISRAPSWIARRVSYALTSDSVRAEREADDRAHLDRRVAQQLGAQRDPGRVDAHRREAVLGRLLAQLDDLVARGLGLEQRVIDAGANAADRRAGRSRATSEARVAPDSRALRTSTWQ